MSEEAPDWLNGRTGGEVTQLLSRMSAGDTAARDEVFTLLYEDLKWRATRAMKSQRKDHELQATALVGEAFERLERLLGKDWRDRGHFLAVAASAMRCVLVDHARKSRVERSESPLDAVVAETESRIIDTLAFDEALAMLAEIEPTWARFAEMLAIGFTKRDAAAALEIPERTVTRRWPEYRAFLYHIIHGE